MRKKELLAPAGDIEAGYAALYYGADAVYLGLSKFSARATAINFDEENLDRFTAYAHHLQRKVYVALNTVLQEDELADLIDSLDLCTRCHVDGLIIQDLGVAHVMKEKYPWFEMHASTQMAVHNKEGALFLKNMGFKRVVVARELTLKEIEEIASIADLEIEAFIHGALCYSYSGLCQFSAVEHGRSANRGKCLYPCRAEFEFQGKKTHLFSMKDMALQADVLKMPVDSLKIEGRKKSALYVAAVTNYYRRILDGKGADQNLENDIKQIFSRPWCQFHFNGKDKSVIDRNFVGHRGLLIGQVEDIYHGQIKFKTAHKIARYDGLQIDCVGQEKPYGFSVQNIAVNHKSVYEADKGETVLIRLPKGYPHIKSGSLVYLASSSAVKGKYKYTKPKESLYRNNNDITVHVNVKNNVIEAIYEQYRASLEGVFTVAKNPEKCDQAIQEAFMKTGNTKLCLKEVVIYNPQQLFVPVSLLNQLRRALYAQIRFEQEAVLLPEVEKKVTPQTQWSLKVDNPDYLTAVNADQFAEIVVLLRPQMSVEALRALPKDKVRLALPAVCRRPEKYRRLVSDCLSAGYLKWEVANYWGLAFLPTEKLDISLASSVYMLNSQAMNMALKIGASGVMFSIEDTHSNIAKLINQVNIQKTLVVSQYVPLFTSVGCIRDNDCSSCPRGELWFNMKRNGRQYNALSRDCQMMVFDAEPLCIAEEAKDLHPDLKQIDLSYGRLTIPEVKNIIKLILSENNVSNCIKANFCSKMI
ncbi:MAG: U32 family peptidase [Alphaproteobacteria bacterium]|nr:U32 family peptidase [Alphaproteobacteria bacterium]